MAGIPSFETEIQLFWLAAPQHRNLRWLVKFRWRVMHLPFTNHANWLHTRRIWKMYKI